MTPMFLKLVKTKCVEPALIIGVLTAVYSANISGVTFHRDESQWISTSYVLEWFVTADFSNPAWDVSYWTLTQPPGARYIIGIGRRLGGFSASELNLPWDFALDNETNIARGAQPSPDLLWWSRLPMALLSVLAIMIGFVIIKRVAGRLAGYLWLIITAVNPYLLQTLRRAMSEAPLFAGSMLAVWVGCRALRSWRSAAAHPDQSARQALVRPALWFGLLGICCGVTGACKLNGLSLIISGAALCVAGPLMLPQLRTHRGLAYVVIVGLVMCCTTAASFILLNPFLYPDVLGRTAQMSDNRRHEMAYHRSQYPSESIEGLVERAQIVPERVFATYAALRLPFGVVINGALCALGIGLALYTLRRRIHDRERAAAGLALVAVAVAGAGPSLMTPLDWGRYFLLPVVFSSAFIAIGFAGGVQYLAARAHARMPALPPLRSKKPGS
jgi:hypothetical protein